MINHVLNGTGQKSDGARTWPRPCSEPARHVAIPSQGPLSGYEDLARSGQSDHVLFTDPSGVS